MSPDEALFYTGQQTIESLIPAALASGGMTQDPRFLQDNGYQSPIQARFGVKFLF